MENLPYKPSPIDTSGIELPPELTALADQIARNVHETWAKERIQEGWTYGETRDDSKKQTPCLVEYDKLSDEEKAYDMNTAFETLRLIVKLGFKISKN